jgi:hypothetical protein
MVEEFPQHHNLAKLQKGGHDGVSTMSLHFSSFWDVQPLHE